MSHRLILLVTALLLASPLIACEVFGIGGESSAATMADAPAVRFPAPGSAEVPDERKLFMDAARAAWSFVERNYQPRTGLVKAHDSYQYVTVWDIGSMLGAYYSAHHLGLIDQADYKRRVDRLVSTLAEVELYDGAAFNRMYDSGTGAMMGRGDRVSDTGFGWSALDLGRLLVWLKIVAVDNPEYADRIQAVVNRLQFDRLVQAGYMRGEDVPERGGVRRFQEGRIGYEQYAAEGFALWGHAPEKALNFRENVKPVTVLGVPLYGDARGGDKLTSEPFIMMGLELGWRTPEWRELAWRVLAAQEARYDQTGIITMVSEDALPDAPHYFYYYTIYHDGQEFMVEALGSEELLDEPRWISTKSAFGWHALLPSSYTWEALEAVAPAGTRQGWASGVYEGSRKSTGVRNMNTAAIVLESALYYHRGRPAMDY